MKANDPRPGSIDPARELPAVTREGARALRELYLGLVREGFTRSEAMELIATMVRQAQP